MTEEIKKEDFYEIYKNLQEIGIINNIFKEKSLYLQTTYKCFTEQNREKDREKMYNNIKTNSRGSHIILERPEKLKIGGRDLSKDTLVRKDFLSLLNRLSDQNKKQIFNQFKTNILPDYYKMYIRMTWEMILKFPDFLKIYINLITILYENIQNKNLFIEELILIVTEYESKKEWIPTDDILDENDYDEFCDYQKWKKRAISAIRCIRILLVNDWISSKLFIKITEQMIEDCNIYFIKSEGIGCKIVDALLDQIIEVCDIIEDKLIVDFINKWLTDIIRSSSKFKLLDIKEKIEIKLSTTYKVKQNKRY